MKQLLIPPVRGNGKRENVTKGEGQGANKKEIFRYPATHTFPYLYRVILLLLLVAAIPVISLACSACQNAAAESKRIAYLATTFFLAALPLLVGGGIFLWIYKKINLKSKI